MMGKSPRAPGEVIIGTIEGVGIKVDHVFELGDRVIGMMKGGGCSRFLPAGAGNFVKAPSSMSNVTALALMQDWMPAYRALRVTKNAMNEAN